MADHVQPLNNPSAPVGFRLLGEPIADNSADGTMIFRAEDNATTGKPDTVVIKFVERGNGHRRRHKYLVREVLALRKLAHDHIVAFLEVVLTDTHLCIICDDGGKSVHDYVQEEGRLNEDLARFLFQQMVRGVHYVHGGGDTLRNITLQNWLVNSSRTVKLCGLSRVKNDVLHSAKVTSDFMEQVYMAPEVMSGMGYGSGADMWAMGICLFFMLCGVHVLENGNLRNQPFEAIMNRLGISEGAKALVLGLLKVDLADRWSMNQVCQSEWCALGWQNVREENNSQRDPVTTKILPNLQPENEVMRMIEAAKDRVPNAE